MYDVTSEHSFLNVRNWMNSVKEGVEEHCVLCVVANKIDLCESEESRAVSFKDGATLAEVRAHRKKSNIAMHYSITSACTSKHLRQMAPASQNA